LLIDYTTKANTGQIKMAARLYSDISGLLTTFISVDRYAGVTPATSLGQRRYHTYLKPINVNLGLMETLKVLKLGFCLSLALIFSGCKQVQKTSDEETTETAVQNVTSTEPTTEERIDFDPDQSKALLKELKGIEKFYVQDDLYRLYSLLKFKNDNRYEDLERGLEKEHASFNPILSSYSILLIDTKNGYMEFNESGADIYYAMTYWNKSYGDKLIGKSTKICSMVACHTSISFQLYEKDTQTYIPKETSEIIIEIDALKKLRPEGFKEGDDEYYDSGYILPQKGKNIRYCVDEKCLDLIWQDGTFSISK